MDLVEADTRATDKLYLPTDASDVTPETLGLLPPFFVFSHDIPWKARVDLQGMAQKYVDSSISSTINILLRHPRPDERRHRADVCPDLQAVLQSRREAQDGVQCV